MNSRTRPLTITISMIGLLLLLSMQYAPAAEAQQDDAAMAAYADAANFQTGGAIDLAIQAWNQFLAEYPKHEMAPLALHYLGVCHMQSEQPDFQAAVKAFSGALRTANYELREESLANCGWCLYASAGAGEQRDANQLKQAIQTFKLLREEFPESRFIDRAIFCSGEAAFGLGQSKQAIDYYNELLSMPNIKNSPLRCDALYVRGIAYEGLDKFDDAFASYRQLIDSCQESELITDVHLRMGDVEILRQNFPQAIESLEQAYQSSDADEDKAYSLIRQAYALIQLDRPAEAAAKYEKLLDEFPQSSHAGSALLASAQSTFRSGDIDQAAKRFRRVLEGSNLAAATEAAHWLARIEIGKSRPGQAAKLLREQIERGTDGPFAAELQLDLAEILSMDIKTGNAAMQLFEQVYRDNPAAPIASRALYNAAFSALQIGQSEHAHELATEFLQRFPDDQLKLDVQFIAAESLLVNRQYQQAAEQYKQLVKSTPEDNVQRPIWLLRTATALNAARRFDETVELVSAELDSITSADQQAEARQLIGRAQILAGRADQAIGSFRTSIETAPQWNGANESRLLLGQAQAAAGNNEQAVSTWSELIQSAPTSLDADQARYRIAQIESSSGNYDRAISLYQEILDSGAAAGIIPHAQYGIAWAKMQLGKYQPAIESLNRLVQEHQDHPLQVDARLARGICLRNLGQFDQAKEDLQGFLTSSPAGTNLGHALYELALIDQKNKAPQQAAEKLARLVSEVPDYPGMDKVLYELGWSLQESGQGTAAVERFEDLIANYPQTPLAADAAYYVGQDHYSAKRWKQAAERFSLAANSTDDSLSEKALYRLGWSQYRLGNYQQSEASFADLARLHPAGKLAFDALAMVAECRFKQGEFKQALEGYSQARKRIQDNDETSTSIRDDAARQVRELALLHGGQSAAQLKQWDTAIDWHNEHRTRFPTSNYLAQVFYETGFAYHQKGDTANAMRFYTQVADKYRSEVGARARFMIGEIHFGDQQIDKAISDFQRVMFGYGAEQAPAEIKNWQAKSGFEAGRCSEVLMNSAKTAQSRQKALNFSVDFYNYVIKKHADHELAAAARKRLEALSE